jgi:hypothetical protein
MLATGGGQNVGDDRSKALLIYESEGLGAETTMRAKVIRELIDEINLHRPRGGSRCRVPNPDSESGGVLAWA